MLICPSCQEKHPLDRKACPHCGTKLDHVRCFACGKWVPGDQTRCPSCKSQLPVVLLMLGNAEQEVVHARYRVLEELDHGQFLVQDTLINREIPESAFQTPTPLMREYLRLTHNPWVPKLLDRSCENGVERLFIEPRINAYGTPLPSIGSFWSNLREEERIRLLCQWLELSDVFAPEFRQTVLDRNNLVIGNYRLFVQRIIPGESEAPMQALAQEWRTLMGEPTGPLSDLIERIEHGEPKDQLVERLNA
ncbi:MAG: double zinc ribbon domain-containing protein, partial [Bacteroidota bacterium]